MNAYEERHALLAAAKEIRDLLLEVRKIILRLENAAESLMNEAADTKEALDGRKVSRIVYQKERTRRCGLCKGTGHDARNCPKRNAPPR